MSYVKAGHLGGYFEGGDEATWYPELWDWFVQEVKVARILDVGCGNGQAIDYFQSIGVPAVGIEGVEQNRSDILTHDFTLGPAPKAKGWNKFDLVWCCEFVEHVEEQYVDNFLDSFKKGDIVAMTHGEPGQGGYHHVNLQESDYWIEKLQGVGFRLDRASTYEARTLAGKNHSPWNHFVRSGMVFRRGE